MKKLELQISPITLIEKIGEIGEIVVTKMIEIPGRLMRVMVLKTVII